MKTLKLLSGRDRSVVIEPVAVGRDQGELVLKLNLDNPTVSTASDAFIRAAHRAPGWQGEQWIDRIAVPMTTLNALIARHGTPAFVKIDVEGYETEALAGLTGPVAALYGLGFALVFQLSEAKAQKSRDSRFLGAHPDDVVG